MDCIVDDLHLHYQDEGTGPTLLLLHGWGSNLHTFDPICDRLKSSYRLVRLDLPGFGKSQLPPTDWSVTDYVTLVAAFLRKLDLEPFAIVGHSFGGRIAIKGLSGGTLRANKLILIASAGVKSAPTLRTQATSFASRLSHLPVFQPFRTGARRLFGSRDYQAAGPLRGTLRKVLDEDLQVDAARITSPTLLIWGKLDTDTPPSDGQTLHERISHSQIEFIPSADHFVHETHAERVAKLIREFLA